MPTQNNKSLVQSQIDRVLKDRPQLATFFEEYPVPEKSTSAEGADPKEVKRLQKVSATYNHGGIVEKDGKKVLTDEGWEFHKEYHDGSKQPIDENEYQTMKAFNKLPAHLKSKYQEEVKDDTDQYGTLISKKQNLDKYGSVDNQKLYDEISEDPASLGAAYFSTLKIKGGGKVTDEAKGFIHN